MLQTFLPLFLMTFGICLFIVLMQFLWRYIDDMVGKGLGIPVLAEMFMYAALFLVPMALPLAILLRESRRTIGITGYEIGGRLTCPYHAPANHHHQYYKYRGFLLPELCHACRTSQTLHATLVYAAEIAGVRYS